MLRLNGGRTNRIKDKQQNVRIESLGVCLDQSDGPAWSWCSDLPMHGKPSFLPDREECRGERAFLSVDMRCGRLWHVDGNRFLTRVLNGDLSEDLATEF